MTLVLSLFLSLSVRGIVVDPSGRPIQGARVSCGLSAMTTAATTDAAGNFELPKACDATISSSGFSDAQASVTEAGPNKVALTLAPNSDRVVVSATGTPLSIVDAGVSATVFTSADFEAKKTPFVADVLRDAPGLAVVQTGQLGGIVSLFARGADSSSAMVLLDGIPLTEPGGYIDLTHLTVPGLDRIEVVRGPSSALFGAEAASGVVQLFTEHGDLESSKPHGSATYERGSFSTDHWTANLNGGFKRRFDYSLTGDQFRSSGEYPNDGYRIVSGTASVGVAFTDSTKLRAVLRSFDAYTGDPGQTYYGLYNLDANSRDRDVALGVKLDDARGKNYLQRVTFAYHRYHDVYNDVNTESYNLVGQVQTIGPYTYFLGLIPPGATPQSVPGSAIVKSSQTLYPYSSETLTHRASASYQGTLTHKGGALTFGYEFEDQAGVISTSNVSRQDNGFYAHEQYAANSWLAFTAGVRVQHSSTFGTETAPRGSVTFRLPTATYFHVSVGRGILEPSLLENFAKETYYVGNAALKPQTTDSFEAGLSREWFRRRVKTDAAYFRNHFDNLIQFDFSKFPATWGNIASAWARGFEFSASAHVVNAVSLLGEYTNLHTYGNGLELLRRPRNSGAVSLDYAPKRFSFEIGARFVGERQDNDFVFGVNRDPAYASAFLTASFHATKHISPFVRIGNLTDERYQDALGYAALSRAAFGGAKVSW